MGGIDLLDEVIERDAKAKDSGGILAFAIHARGADKRIVRAENHRVSVNKKQFFHGLPIYRFKAVFNEIVICSREMSTSVKTAIDGERRRVRGL